jgi:hypothetical protein
MHDGDPDRLLRYLRTLPPLTGRNVLTRMLVSWQRMRDDWLRALKPSTLASGASDNQRA